VCVCVYVGPHLQLASMMGVPPPMERGGKARPPETAAGPDLTLPKAVTPMQLPLMDEVALPIVVAPMQLPMELKLQVRLHL
jgi:hypothetical protein